MGTFDRVLLILGTVLVVGTVAWTAESGTRGPEPLVALVPLDDAGRDPAALAAYATERLPEGVRIDPETLRLVGLVLEPVAGSTVVDWDVLQRYEYEEELVGLPDDIRALDGRKVTIAGFLLPLYEFDDIREFNLVASHWSCCFGVPPGMSGWVRVVLRRGRKGLPNTTQPLRVTGTLRVAEHLEAGYVVAIYSIDDAEAEVIGW